MSQNEPGFENELDLKMRQIGGRFENESGFENELKRVRFLEWAWLSQVLRMSQIEEWARLRQI